MIAPCIINCLTYFVSAQVNKLQHAVPVQQGYIKLPNPGIKLRSPELQVDSLPGEPQGKPFEEDYAMKNMPFEEDYKWKKRWLLELFWC